MLFEMNSLKPQIPSDDRKILDNLVSKLQAGAPKEKNQADLDLTRILADYNSRGFDTTRYAAELLKYAATKMNFVLTE